MHFAETTVVQCFPRINHLNGTYRALKRTPKQYLRRRTKNTELDGVGGGIC